jgi:hypothetical protein
MVLRYTSLERLRVDQPSSLSGPFVSKEENEVLWIQPQSPLLCWRNDLFMRQPHHLFPFLAVFSHLIHYFVNMLISKPIKQNTSKKCKQMLEYHNHLFLTKENYHWKFYPILIILTLSQMRHLWRLVVIIFSALMYKKRFSSIPLYPSR